MKNRGNMMQMRSATAVKAKSQTSILSTHQVLRNTYFLLSLTLLFSAGTATFAMLINAAPVNLIVLLVGIFGLQFLTIKLRNSIWGLASIFAFTGFMGYTLGPILNFYLQAFSNGGQIIMTALGSTGLIFLGLSAYAMVSRKDFGYLGGFLFAAAMVAFMAGLGGIFFNMPILNLVVSGAFALIASGYILFTTSQIIHGGEKNYIMAAISLYVALFNLFVSLLRILAAFAGNRN
jgi:modulator of FtsH protease